jgi:hypothetical protein
MTFESGVVAFSERFLSERTFQLVVAPALADLEFEPGTTPLAKMSNRLAVIRAAAGGLCHDLKRDVLSLALLTLVPTCYYLCLLVLCFDAFRNVQQMLGAVGILAAMGLVPVMVCFWPARRPMRPGD